MQLSSSEAVEVFSIIVDELSTRENAWTLDV